MWTASDINATLLTATEKTRTHDMSANLELKVEQANSGLADMACVVFFKDTC